MPALSRRGKSRSMRAPQHASLVWLACALAALGIAPAQGETVYRETVLHNLGPSSSGAGPTSGVIRDSADNL